MESLPSRNNFTHRATVRYGKAASPHVSRSTWKQFCSLRPRANSIFIQERWSCFVNILLGRLNWASTLQDDAQCNSNTSITTHCTTSTELMLSGTDDRSVTRRTSFKLQQCCHYFVSNTCVCIYIYIYIYIYSAFGKSLYTYKRCLKWCPRASIQAWPRLILFADTFYRSACYMFLT